MRTPGSKSKKAKASGVLSVRLGAWARIEAQGSGAVVAIFETDSVMLGRFGAGAFGFLDSLRLGLPLSSLSLGGHSIDKETDLLVRRLSGAGLLEFFIPSTENGDGDLFVIEPQIAGYVPTVTPLEDDDCLVLSRFAYLRRRGHEIVVESPRAAALFRLLDPRLTGFLSALTAPRPVHALKTLDGFPGMEALAALADGQILVKADQRHDNTHPMSEGDSDLALWEFHDLLFHARSTEGRHANPVGGVYPHSGTIPELPALRPAWPGEKIDLCASLDEASAPPAIASAFRQSRSIREYDDRHPITLAELSRFLDGAARGVARPGNPAPVSRPFPSAGASSELELYLSVHLCEGLAPGFYHYDAGEHALAAIDAAASDVKATLSHGASAMGVTVPPQVLVTMAARFGRVSWKYSSIAYSLILKDAGVLTQTLYLMASGMGLGGCAIGIANIAQFEKMTGLAFHVEGPVGQFALGRPRS